MCIFFGFDFGLVGTEPRPPKQTLQDAGTRARTSGLPAQGISCCRAAPADTPVYTQPKKSAAQFFGTPEISIPGAAI